MCRRNTLIILSVACVALTAFLAVQIPRQRRLVRESIARNEHDRAVRYFSELKRGETKYPTINSPELMSMIANDKDLVSQLTYVHFDNTDLNAPEFRRFQEFPNIKVISFYDCESEETLLGYASKMPSVNEVCLYYARPTDDLLKQLKSIPNLETIKYNDIDNLDEFKLALPNVRFEVNE